MRRHWIILHPDREAALFPLETPPWIASVLEVWTANRMDPVAIRCVTRVVGIIQFPLDHCGRLQRRLPQWMPILAQFTEIGSTFKHQASGQSGRILTIVAESDICVVGLCHRATARLCASETVI